MFSNINIFNMENNKTCSLKQHSETKAISYCHQCDIYMCSKCKKNHSELCQRHIPYNLSIDKQNIFTGICQTKNHSEKLVYFCKNHNELCCAACITKIKGNGNGQHTDCDICYIEDIKNEKINKFKDNLKSLENISSNIEESINNLKLLYEKINNEKEELKQKIQEIFTKIREELNDREDKILLEIDQKYAEIYFNEEVVTKGENLPKKVNELIKQGNLINKEWNESEKNLSKLINVCINIEKNIKDIDNINNNIEKCNNINYEFKFSPLEKDEKFTKFLKEIKEFGLLNYHNYNKQKEKNEKPNSFLEPID